MGLLLLDYKKPEEPREPTYRETVRMGINPKELKPEQELFLRLFASGVPRVDACLELKKSEDWAYELLNSAVGQNYLMSLQGLLDLEFQNLYQEVIDCIKTGLSHTEPSVYLSAASLWLKTSKNKITVEVSAEDIIKRLMDGGEKSAS